MSSLRYEQLEESSLGRACSAAKALHRWRRSGLLERHRVSKTLRSGLPTLPRTQLGLVVRPVRALVSCIRPGRRWPGLVLRWRTGSTLPLPCRRSTTGVRRRAEGFTLLASLRHCW